MSKKGTRSLSQGQVTLLTVLAVGFVIALGSFFVGQMLGGENQIHPQQQEEMTSEEAQSSSVYPAGVVADSGDLTAVSLDGYHYPDVSTTGLGSQYEFDYCVLVPAVEPTGVPSQIHSGNAIRIPQAMCVNILMHISSLYNQGMISEDVLRYPVEPM